MAYPGDSISLAFAGLNTPPRQSWQKNRPYSHHKQRPRNLGSPCGPYPGKGNCPSERAANQICGRTHVHPHRPRPPRCFIRRPNPQADSKRMSAAARLEGRADRQSASSSIGRTALQTGRKRRYRYSGGSHRQTVGSRSSGGECHRLI